MMQKGSTGSCFVRGTVLVTYISLLCIIQCRLCICVSIAHYHAEKSYASISEVGGIFFVEIYCVIITTLWSRGGNAVVSAHHLWHMESRMRLL